MLASIKISAIKRLKPWHEAQIVDLLGNLRDQ
jgi:hypothetical protein